LTIFLTFSLGSSNKQDFHSPSTAGACLEEFVDKFSLLPPKILQEWLMLLLLLWLSLYAALVARLQELVERQLHQLAFRVFDVTLFRLMRISKDAILRHKSQDFILYIVTFSPQPPELCCKKNTQGSQKLHLR